MDEMHAAFGPIIVQAEQHLSECKQEFISLPLNGPILEHRLRALNDMILELRKKYKDLNNKAKGTDESLLEIHGFFQVQRRLATCVNDMIDLSLEYLGTSRPS